MNEETVGTLFEYPYHQFLMTRLEFVLLTQDDLEARIMRIIEVELLKEKARWQHEVYHALEKKQTPPEEPEEFWVSISQSLFLAFLYKHDTALVGARHPNSMSKSTLRRALASLLDKQLLKTRGKPGDEYSATQYTFNKQVVEERLRQLPKNPMTLFFQGAEGSFQIANSPSSQIANSPVPNLETPQFSNWELLNNNINNTIQDKDTYIDAAAADVEPTPLFPHQAETSIPSEPPVLQAEKPENTPDSEKTHQTTPARKKGSQGAKQPIATENSLLPIAPEGQAPAEAPAKEAPAKEEKKRTRRDRLDAVYACLDACASTALQAEFAFTRSAKNDKVIGEWLARNPGATHELLAEVFDQLLSEKPDERSGFAWSKNMDVAVILKQYDRRVFAIKLEQRKKRDAERVRATPVPLPPPPPPVIPEGVQVKHLLKSREEKKAALLQMSAERKAAANG